MRVCLIGGIFGKPPEYRRRHSWTPETVLADELRRLGVEVETFGHGDAPDPGRFDLVHVHHLGRGAVRLARRVRRPAFVFTGHDGAFICGREPSRLRRAAFRAVLSRADAVVALSEAEGRVLERASGRAVARIPNGIPVRRFPLRDDAPPGTRPAASGEVSRAPRLLFVGQLTRLKGVDVLLRALATLSAPPAPLLTLCYQVDERETEYRRMCEELGIAGRVDFAGFRSTDDLSDLYRDSDLVVLPSRAEASPSTIAEALLSGTPVVATRVGGVAEQLAGLGRLAPAEDAGALARAIADVLRRPAEWRARVAAARPGLESRFDLARMARRHRDLYERVLRAGRALGRALAEEGVPSRAYWRGHELAELARLHSEVELEGPVLDVGCGDGRFGSLVFDRIDDGVDASPTAVRRCRERTTYARVHEMAAERLSLPEDRYGTVFSNSVLEHVEDLDAALRAMRSRLRSGGRLVATVPLRAMERHLAFDGGRYARLRRRQLVHRHLLTAGQWRARLRDAGFRDIEVRGYLPASECRAWDRLDLPMAMGLGRVTVGGVLDRLARRAPALAGPARRWVRGALRPGLLGGTGEPCAALLLARR